MIYENISFFLLVYPYYFKFLFFKLKILLKDITYFSSSWKLCPNSFTILNIFICSKLIILIFNIKICSFFFKFHTFFIKLIKYLYLMPKKQRNRLGQFIFSCSMDKNPLFLNGATNQKITSFLMVIIFIILASPWLTIFFK